MIAYNNENDLALEIIQDELPVNFIEIDGKLIAL